ncbi:PatB family C-S lyase [Vagococcus sp. BWB3-3]|uniref:cysteine-S-conjugate beta-lyase n=1 Tax=Vagococcus allomyrinae TaxID=2794353 RepID=A0A940P766_9ENTE|nr:PatB family C-S lyase [Vagococcus allomyrinae]MBP1042919.1 PatB family C-S lyase [Vagococcus allomyrinae]
MTGEFDQVYNRKGTNSKKWDDADQKYLNPEVIPMWLADMDFKVAPCISRKMASIVEQGIMGYPASINHYKPAVIEWLEQEYDWQVSLSEIFFTQTIFKGLSFVIRALTRPGDSILVNVPCYGPFIEIIEKTGRKAVLSPLKVRNGRYEMDMADTRQQLVAHQCRLLILCNPHNPTGRVWEERELLELLAVCQSLNVTILSDDIHSELIMPGVSYTPIAKIAKEMKEQIVTFKSPSKAFNISGIRIGYFITANRHWRAGFEELRRRNGEEYSANSFSGEVLKTAYEEGKEWLNQVIVYCYENYCYLKERLANYDKVLIATLEGTYLVWFNLEAYGQWVSETELASLLDASGIGVQTGSEFGTPGLFIRLNIACPRSVLSEGLSRMLEVIEELEGRSNAILKE